MNHAHLNQLVTESASADSAARDFYTQFDLDLLFDRDFAEYRAIAQQTADALIEETDTPSAEHAAFWLAAADIASERAWVANEIARVGAERAWVAQEVTA